MRNRGDALKKARFNWQLLLAGIFILAFTGMIALLSHSFVFGEDHPDRPFFTFFYLTAFSFIAYFIILEIVRRREKTVSSRSQWVTIIAIGIFCRCVLMFSQPIQETDPNRYFWDGQQILHGQNPYIYSPLGASQSPEGQRLLGEKGASEIYRKINYPEIKTIYPPVSQIFFAVSQIMTPWSSVGWRLIVFFADTGAMVLLALSLSRLKIAAGWLVLYAWSPLVLKEFSNSLHVDVLAVFFLTAFIYFAIRSKPYGAFASLALVTGAKWFGVILLPLYFIWICRKDTTRAIWGMVGFFAILTLVYLPFASAGEKLFEGLGVFAKDWQVNEGFYNVVEVGVASLPFVPDHLMGLGARVTCLVLLGVMMLGAMRWLRDKEDIRLFFKACLIVMSSVFFLAPTGNPWYFTWVLPFLVFYPARSLIIFSGLVFFILFGFLFNVSIPR